MIKIVVDRKYKMGTYTISNLTINGKKFCETIEDTDRNLDSSMSPEYIKSIKSKSGIGVTAIPRGTYKVTMDVVSPKYYNMTYYRQNYDGRMPRLLNVPGFEGVLIHPGNTEKDSAGCIIVGENKVKGKVINSKATFDKLYKELMKDKDNIYITIL